MNRVGLLPFVLCLSVAVPVGAADLKVRVLDEQGGPLPGAIVTARAVAGDPSSRTEQADGKGLVQIDGMDSSEAITLTVSFPGFVPVTVALERIDTGSPTYVVRLRESETKIVCCDCRSHHVDLENTKVSSTFSSSYLQDLPGNVARDVRRFDCE